MSYTHALSKREKSLAIVGVALLLVLLVVGYAKATVGQAGILVAQETPTPTPTPTPTMEQKPDNDCENQKNHIKNQDRYIKDQEREITNIEKQSKTSATAARDILVKFKSCISALPVCTSEFWDKNQDCNGFQTDLQNEFNDNLYPLRDCAESKSNIDNRRKEKKSNIDRQIKDILRNDKTADVSILTNITSQLDAQFGKADALLLNSACTRETADALNDVAREFDGLFQDFYNSSNEVNQKANEGRQVQDNQRDYEKDKKKRCDTDKARELKNFGKEVKKSIKAGDSDAQAAYDSVNQIYGQMCVDALGAMKTALDNKDTEAYNEARSTYDELDRTFWDTMNESRQGVQEKRQKVEQLKNVTRDLKRWTGEIKRMQVELKKTERLYNRTAKKYANREDRKTELAAFAEYISQAKNLIKKIEDGLAAAKEESASDPDAWWLERQDELNELQQEFYEMQQNVQMIGNVIQVLTQAEKDIIKGTAKQLKQLARESNNDPELMGALNSIVNQAKDGLKSAWSQLFSEPEDAMSALADLERFRQDWEDTINDWRESRFEGEEE